jgi:hypothetical protein
MQGINSAAHSATLKGKINALEVRDILLRIKMGIYQINFRKPSKG